MNRSIALCIVYSIITLGIYMFYWIYKINEESAKLTDEPEIINGGMLILLTIVTCSIYWIYWSYKIGERFDRLRQKNGEMPGNLSVIYLILTIFGLGIITSALMQSEENKVVPA